nr:InlB B-repeat-containing protein [Lachnospiraceae bacterium]
AEWTAIPYSLELHPGNGQIDEIDTSYRSEEISEEYIYYKDYDADDEDFTLPTPHKDYYTFCGWHKESITGDVINKIVSGSFGDLDLFAEYEPTNYTISLNADGGVINNKTFTKASDSTIYTANYNIESEDVELPTATKQGYTFDGWYAENAESKTTSVAKGSNGNKSYKAKWTPNAITDPQPVSKSNAKPITDSITPVVAPKQETSQPEATTNTTKTYRITYVLYRGKNNKKNPKKYTAGKGLKKLYAPSKKGYKFVGWFKDKKKKKKIASISKKTIGPVTIYAKWKKK